MSSAPGESGQSSGGFTLPPRYNPVLTADYARRFVGAARELEHRGSINATCVDRNSFYTCGDNNIRRWNISTAACEASWKIKDGGQVSCMTSSDAGWLWCGKRNGVLCGVDTASGAASSLTQSEEPVVAVASCGTTDTLWSLTEDGMLLQHDLRSSSVIFRASLRQHVRRRALNFEVRCAPQIELANGEVWVLWCGSILVVDEESGGVAMAKRLPRSDGKGEDPVTTMARVHTARWCCNASSRVTAWVGGDLVGEINLPREAGSAELVCTCIARTDDGLLWCALSDGRVAMVSPGHEAVLMTWPAHNSGVKTLHAVAHREAVLLSTLSEYGSVRLWTIQAAELLAAHTVLLSSQQRVSRLPLNLRLLTWNVNEWTPFNGSSRAGVAKWLVGGGNSDVVVLGIQEAVPLNAQQAVATNTGVAEEWEDYLKLCLDKVGSYVLLQTVQLVGVVLVVCVRSDFVHAVSEVESAVVKVGFKGLLGNKGAACVRFRIFEDTVAFVCTHLAAGQKDVKARNEHHHTITAELRFEPSQSTLLEHAHVFWIGDLNYRIDLPNEEVRSLCAAEGWDELYEHDQLYKAQQAGAAFEHYDEAPISFGPTYKYDHGTDVYDSSKKKRSPAYCDRVLWRRSPAVRPRGYGRHELLQSDHRPVFADLELDVRLVHQQQVVPVPPPPEPQYNMTAVPALEGPGVAVEASGVAVAGEDAELAAFFG